MRLDKIDKKILIILQRNAKITNSKLSKEIGLSPAPTLERVRKLESNGIISGYHAKLDKSKLGLGVSTFVMVSLKVHNKKNLLSYYYIYYHIYIYNIYVTLGTSEYQF